MWNEALHKQKKCACGQLVSAVGWRRHQYGLRHLHGDKIKFYLEDRGLSYAEIARLLRVSRVYVREVALAMKEEKT